MLGSDLPEINLVNYAGDQVTVGGLRSEEQVKKIYLLLWSAQNDKSVEALKLSQVLMNKSVFYADQFYAVNVDTEDSKQASAKIIDQNELSFKLLLDFEKKLIKKIMFEKTPLLLVISSKGVILSAIDQFDENLEMKIKKN